MVPWTEYSRFFIALFAILTPFAAIPIFLSLTEGQGEKEKAHTARTAVLTIAILLVAAAFLGESILRIIGTSLHSFRVGGGLVLLLMALSMMNAPGQLGAADPRGGRGGGSEAGGRRGPDRHPAACRPRLDQRRDHPDGAQRRLGASRLVVACILFVCALVWGALSLATPIGDRLGRTGLNIVNRLFGLMLAAIAVEVIAAGLRALFPGLA